MSTNTTTRELGARYATIVAVVATLSAATTACSTPTPSTRSDAPSISTSVRPVASSSSHTQGDGGDLREQQKADDLRRLDLFEETFERTPRNANEDERFATAITTTINTRYVESFSRIRAECRSNLCRVNVHLRDSNFDEEKRIINQMALESHIWAPGSTFSEYIRAGTIDEEGRFLIWRNGRPSPG